MTITIRTAPYGYSGPGRLDVTRVGVDRAINAGKPAPGSAFAPSPAILWPAKSHIDLVAALERRAASVPAGEAAAFVAVQADELLRLTEAAYRKLYLAELRVSAGLRPGSEQWGEDEDIAWKHGVRPQRDAWRALLDGSLAGTDPVLVCFCPRREPGAGQRHHCHRHHLARALAAFGAVDAGEIESPPAHETARKKVGPPLEQLVAISGCRPPGRGEPREAHDLHRQILADVADTVASLPPGTVVLHGGAEGVDKTAGEAAKRAGHVVEVFSSWWDAWGREAPLIRNVYVCAASRCIAWPAPQSRGTYHAINLARKAGVEVDERRPW